MFDWFSGVKEEICKALEGTAGSTSEDIRNAVALARATRKHRFPNGLTRTKIESALKKLQKRNWVTMKGIRKVSFCEAFLDELVYVLSLAGQQRSRSAGPDLDDLGKPISGSCS